MSFEQKESRVPFISVIVPVYNTKRYLRKCLNSLKRQSLQEIEIIVIDDGSTDGSGQICDEFSKTDTRFNVIHTSNKGLSSARNKGLEISNGEYIMFVDSDDWIESDFCEVPFTIAKSTGADIVVFRFVMHNKRKDSTSKLFPTDGLASKEEVLIKLWDECVWAAVWNKLFKRDLFYGITYPKDRFYEDAAITHHLIYKSNNVYLSNRILYHYRDYRPGSITNKKSYKLYNDYFFCNFQRIDDLKSWGFDCSEAEEKFSYAYLISMGNKADLSDRCRRTINECSARVGRTFNLRQKLMAYLYSVSPPFFNFICMLSRKRVRA